MTFLEKILSFFDKKPAKKEASTEPEAQKERVWLPGADIESIMAADKPKYDSWRERVIAEGMLTADAGEIITEDGEFTLGEGDWLSEDPEAQRGGKTLYILRPAEKKAPHIRVRVKSDSVRHRNLAGVDIFGHYLIRKEHSALVCLRPRGLSSHKCPICGRKLTDPISREIGLGPRCLKHFSNMNMPSVPVGQTGLVEKNWKWIEKFRQSLKNKDSHAVIVTWLRLDDVRIDEVGKTPIGKLLQKEIYRLDGPVPRPQEGQWTPGLWGSLLDRKPKIFHL